MNRRGFLLGAGKLSAIAGAAAVGLAPFQITHASAPVGLDRKIVMTADVSEEEWVDTRGLMLRKIEYAIHQQDAAYSMIDLIEARPQNGRVIVTTTWVKPRSLGEHPYR